MELEKLARLIAEEFVAVLAEAFDQMAEPDLEEEATRPEGPTPKVMTAGGR